MIILELTPDNPIADIFFCKGCGYTDCICGIEKKHYKNCKFRRSVEMKFAIECEHNKEICEICDKCNCADKIEKLIKFQQDAIAKETGPLFMKLPDRWYEKPGPKWRCIEGHISSCLLKSEEFGSICMACFGNVILTFPEDEEMVMDGK